MPSLHIACTRAIFWIPYLCLFCEGILLLCGLYVTKTVLQPLWKITQVEVLPATFLSIVGAVWNCKSITIQSWPFFLTSTQLWIHCILHRSISARHVHALLLSHCASARLLLRWYDLNTCGASTFSALWCTFFFFPKASCNYAPGDTVTLHNVVYQVMDAVFQQNLKSVLVSVNLWALGSNKRCGFLACQFHCTNCGRPKAPSTACSYFFYLDHLVRPVVKQVHLTSPAGFSDAYQIVLAAMCKGIIFRGF